MRKFLAYICVSVILICSSFAGYKVKKINKVRMLDYLTQCNTFMVEGNADGTAITSIQYELMALRVKRWLSDNFIELKVNLSREWLEAVANSLVAMNKHKLFIETAKANGTTHTDDYKSHRSGFYNAYNEFVSLLKSPQEPTKEAIALLKEKRAELEAENKKAAGHRKKPTRRKKK